MSEFIKSYGILIIAIYGVMQYWIIALWKKYFPKGKVDIYETGTIEISYFASGTTVGLNGTLRALNRDVFIKSIDLLVIRNKDKAQHTFRWVAFRPPKIDLAGTQPISMEIPSGFLISPDSPYRYNIVFNDNELFDDIRPLLNTYISEWYKVAEQLTKIWPPSVGVAAQPEKIVEQNKLIENFKNSVIRLDAFDSLNRKCYWDQGDYCLTINVRTSKPDKVFSKRYKFSINEDDAKNLKFNIITILDEQISKYLRVQNYPYNFAYSKYK